MADARTKQWTRKRMWPEMRRSEGRLTKVCDWNGGVVLQDELSHNAICVQNANCRRSAPDDAPCEHNIRVTSQDIRWHSPLVGKLEVARGICVLAGVPGHWRIN